VNAGLGCNCSLRVGHDHEGGTESVAQLLDVVFGRTVDDDQNAWILWRPVLVLGAQSVELRPGGRCVLPHERRVRDDRRQVAPAYAVGWWARR
jgi:hypothetical protein